MATDQSFDYYAERFDTVEINNTFYQFPSADTLAAWCNAAPRDFLFSVKASRYITHMKKLKDPESSTAKFFNAIRSLHSTLGPVLFQLPPKWKPNIDRLRDFLKTLPSRHRYTFEFRDSRWISEDVLNVLEEYETAFCIYHLAGYESPLHVTADFTYVRLHGPNDAYEGSYSSKALKRWAKILSGWADDGLDVYCYFDNDEAGYAPRNAQTLADYCSRK